MVSYTKDGEFKYHILNFFFTNSEFNLICVGLLPANHLMFNHILNDITGSSIHVTLKLIGTETSNLEQNKGLKFR